MSEMIERVAEAMYWGRANPDRGHIMLDVAVARWEDLPDEFRSGGGQMWHCKQFWLDAAEAAIRAMREPTDDMMFAGGDHGPLNYVDFGHDVAANVWRGMIDAAVKDA